MLHLARSSTQPKIFSRFDELSASLCVKRFVANLSRDLMLDFYVAESKARVARDNFTLLLPMTLMCVNIYYCPSSEPLLCLFARGLQRCRLQNTQLPGPKKENASLETTLNEIVDARRSTDS